MKHIQATVKLLSGLSLGLMLQTAWAGNITDIKVTSLNDNKKIVKITFDRDVAEPKGFVTGTPPTIALDFPGTSLNLNQTDFAYNDSLLGKILAAETNGRSRLAIDLRETSEYYTERKGDEIWVHISSKNTASGVTASLPKDITAPTPAPFVSNPAQLPSNENEYTHSGVSVDFKKGSSGRGEITLNLPNPKTKFDIQKLNDRLLITLPDTNINTAEQKKLDVSTFGTPVRFINLTRQNSQTQLEIITTGGWTYQNKLENGRQVFHVMPQKNVSQGGVSVQNQKFKGGKVTLDFQNVEVRTILQILAKESGMNIVASDSVQGNMTISLKDVPWDQALQLVLDARDLDKRQNGNIINVAPREELLAKDKRNLTAAKELEELGPLVSQSFQLKYKSVDEFRTVLNIPVGGASSTNDRNSILSSRGSALIDPATNTIIINDVMSSLRKIQALIEELDVPSQQVMVEARIIEAGTGFSRELGAKWFGQYARMNSNGNTGVGAGIAGAAGNSGSNTSWAGPMGFANIPSINLGATAPTSNIAIVRQTLSGALGLELSASEATNKTKTISSPRVLTQNGKKAEIKSGTEIPYQEASSSGATSTSFKEAVLGLVVTPRITPDGNIIMDLDITNDSVDNTCRASEPCISTNNLNSTVMVENGGTIIVGGIYRQSLGNGSDKVPLLGDLPVVGNLFKRQTKNDEQRELLIFITPRIMSATGTNLRY